ncbi:MAG: MBL fold metallo-hydrolase [Gammaproteobacteria bacterium]|nr:MAG: MBL fold metallo-hydrolase [Gammaproteobacteria bacterium]
MHLEFHGADQGVTGSCHLLYAQGKRILVDCGMYQGSRELEEENAEPFGFDPKDIDYLLLTHAHLDHCGRIPLLVKRGFRGEIITTAATRELARLVMLDAAHLEEEEVRWKQRKARRSGKDPKQIVPLYDTLDALNSLDYFGRTAKLRKPFELCPGIEVSFHDAGHILGSASILVRIGKGRHPKRILFSGDLGNGQQPIVRAPDRAPRADAVLIETTYGNRRHKPLGPSVEELYQAILDTLRRGGNVLIPTFALERAQAILYFLREGIEQGVLPEGLPVFLDSPMAISATQIFRHHPECFDKPTRALFESGKDPFALPNLHFTRETAESMALNQIVSGAVIMAGSGMCTGGRIRHHLKHHLWREESSVIFVGYAANGTLARRIIDGAKRVKIFGEEIPVRARIHTIGGFSAHADQEDLLRWYAPIDPEVTFLVHGEPESMQAFAERLNATRVLMPKLGDFYHF